MFNLHYFQYLLWNCLCKPSDTNAVTTNKSNTEVNTNVHRLKGNEIEHSLSGPREFTAAMNWRCSCIVQMSLDFLRSSISVTVPLFSLISLSNVAVASVVVRYDSWSICWAMLHFLCSAPICFRNTCCQMFFSSSILRGFIRKSEAPLVMYFITVLVSPFEDITD